MTSWLHVIDGALCDDELATMTVGETHDVRDAFGVFFGQVAHNDINGQGDGWMARDAWHAEWGDIPGRMMGWAGWFPTREAAEDALRVEVRRLSRR